MKNDTKKFKWILNFVNVLYGVNSLGIIALVLGGLVNLAFPFKGYDFDNGWHFILNNDLMTIRGFFVMIYSLIMVAVILGTIRKFLKNLINEQIFIKENVILAKRASLFSLLASFEGGAQAVLTINGSGFINLTFVFAALLIWVFAKLLEKAVAIAEENEFTI